MRCRTASSHVAAQAGLNVVTLNTIDRFELPTGTYQITVRPQDQFGNIGNYNSTEAYR